MQDRQSQGSQSDIAKQGRRDDRETIDKKDQIGKQDGQGKQDPGSSPSSTER